MKSSTCALLKLALTLFQVMSLCQSSSSSSSSLSFGNKVHDRISMPPTIVSSASTSTSTSTLTSTSTSPSSFQLSPEQLANYKRDGYVIIKGLLRGKELKDAVRTAKQLNRISLPQRLYNIFFSGYRKLSFQTWRKYKSMEYIVFDSAVPSIVAQLMGYGCANKDKDKDKVKDMDKELNKDEEEEEEEALQVKVPSEFKKESKSKSKSKSHPSIRLIKDAFLVYQDQGKGCGWHVDDKFFWPCEDSPLSKHKTDAGVNVWITLSPLKASEGGGLAIAPTSHSIHWREDARAVIAVPPQGGVPQTCAMEQLSPEYHEKFERMKRTFDMEPGDAIIHDRYVFHRTDQFKKEKRTFGFGFMKRSKLRISLRYMPSKATVFVFDAGVQDVGFVEKNMKTGDAVEKGGEYFPQVWPTSLKSEREVEVKEEDSGITWGKFISFYKMMNKMNKEKKKKAST